MLKDLLKFSWMYELSQNIFGLPRFRKTYISQYVRPKAGMRVLDVGCGPGVIVPYFKEVAGIRYHGIDLSPDYVEKARAAYGSKDYTFECADLKTLKKMKHGGGFDIVMMNGVLHHITDGQALETLGYIKKLLRKGGRFCSFDGVYSRGISWPEKFVLDNDRGKFIRTPEHYAKIVKKVFPRAKYEIRSWMLNIPAPIIIFY